MALKRKEVNGMWKEPCKVYLMITSGLLCLALFATSEPVCYTGEKLDDLNTVIKQTDCNGDPDLICGRFDSRKDPTILTVLNSLCGNGEGHPSTGKVSSQENDRAITCSKKDLLGVDNGSFDCPGISTTVSKGDVCPLTCQDGFYPAFAKQAVCQTGASNTGGVWSNETFACNATTCSTSELENVLNGSFNCTDNYDVTMGGICTLVCDDGFYPAFSKEAVCEARGDEQGGQWSVGNFTCRAILCQDVDLPSVESGYFNCSGYSVGDKCNLTCDDGYYSPLSKETVCEEKDDFKGNWTVRNFTCSAVTCSSNDLPRVDNGSFDCPANSNLSKGDVCPLTCQDGFYLAFAKQAVCQTGASNSGGVWSNETFACNEITCSTGALENVLNGSFNCTDNSDVTVNDNCTLVCDDGFYPAFSKEAVCEAKGDDQGGKWSEGNFTCREIKCFTDDLPNIKNGTVHCLPGNVTFEGGVCNVTCADGFYTSPSSRTVCRAGTGINGGEWFPDEISCHPFECTEWNEWNGNEYKLYNVSQSWTVSNTSCVDNNAQLVTIRNEEEQDFVQKLTTKCGSRKPIWIGLNKHETVGVWQWVDQTDVVYQNWGSGRPTNTNNYNCANLRRGDRKWYNENCLQLKYSVCKKQVP